VSVAGNSTALGLVAGLPHKFQQARNAIPGAAVLMPAITEAARAASRASREYRKPTTVSVSATSTGARIRVRGPGAEEAADAAVQSLEAALPRLHSTIRDHVARSLGL
jgi:hypothetical protein